MERIVIETEIAAPPAAVFDWVKDFPNYADATNHIAAVRRLDGSPTRYAVTGQWRSLEHSVTSRVTTVEAPDRIGWELEGPLEAKGRWELDGIDADGHHTRVRTVIEYDLSSVTGIGLGLPPLATMFGIREKAHDVIIAEVRRVLQAAIVALEGTARDPPLEVNID